MVESLQPRTDALPVQNTPVSLLPPERQLRQIHSEYECDLKKLSARRQLAVEKAGTLLAPPKNQLQEKMKRMGKKLGLTDLRSCKSQGQVVDIPVFIDGKMVDAVEEEEEAKVEAAICLEDETQYLNVEEGSSVLVVQGLTYTDTFDVVEYVKTIYPSGITLHIGRQKILI